MDKYFPLCMLTSFHCTVALEKYLDTVIKDSRMYKIYEFHCMDKTF